MSKYFEIHWKDGKTEYLKGLSISDAFNKNGIGLRAIPFIDYYCEAKSLPMEKKEIWLIRNGKSEQIPDGTLFAKQVREQLAQFAKGIKDISVRICNSVCNCEVQETNYKVLLKERA